MCRVLLAPTKPRNARACRKAARCFDERNGVPYCQMHARPVREFCSPLDRRFKHNRVTCQGLTQFKKALPLRRCRNPSDSLITELCRTHTRVFLGEEGLVPLYEPTDSQERRIDRHNRDTMARHGPRPVQVKLESE